MWGIEFQTPAERIYTKTALFKQKIVVRVSNSSGGNLHIISTALGRDLIAFQTPTEKIYTQNRYRRSEIDLAGFKLQRRNLHAVMICFQWVLECFKLQRRNLHAAKRRSRNDESAFQPPVEQIYTVYRPGAKIPLNRVSTSSGGNLHRLDTAIVSLPNRVSTSSGGNLHHLKGIEKGMMKLFQPPVEEIYTQQEFREPRQNSVSTSSGGNLHSVRNSIFSGYEYLKFIFLPLKFR